MNRTGKHAGTIILTGFEPEFELSSVRTVIEEYKNINRTQMHAAYTDYTDLPVRFSLGWQAG